MRHNKKGCVTVNVNCCGNGGGNRTAPFIGENGNWFIENQDTGVTAQGKDGATPIINSSGRWEINGIDTGVHASGATAVSLEPDNAIIEKPDGLYVKKNILPESISCGYTCKKLFSGQSSAEETQLAESINDYDQVIVFAEWFSPSDPSNCGSQQSFIIPKESFYNHRIAASGLKWTDFRISIGSASSVVSILFGFKDDGRSLMRYVNSSPEVRFTEVYGIKFQTVFRNKAISGEPFTHYTLEECEIGTFLNGKTIYRLLLSETEVISDDYCIDLSQYNIGQVINISGCVMMDDTCNIITLGAYYSPDEYISAYYDRKAQLLKLKMGSAYTSGSGGQITVIIEYTKM